MFVFDLDGTLLDSSGQIPVQIIHGISNLWDNGFETTVITGRGYMRLVEALGSYLDAVIGPGPQWIGLEQGARVSTSDGQQNIDYKSFTGQEIGFIIESIVPEETDFIGFFPEAPNSRSIIWTDNLQKKEALLKRYAHNAEVVSSPLKNLPHLIAEANPCMVTLKTHLPDYAGRVDRRLNFYDGGKTINILPGEANKASALEKIAKAKGAVNISVAADDLNDLPMLNFPGLSIRVIVGPKIPKEAVSCFGESIFVDSPEYLGEFLSNFRRR